MFRGNTGVPVQDWVEELRACLRVRQMRPLEQAYYIYDQLEEEAKDEIRNRPKEDREDSDTILSVLQEVYGCAKSQVFYNKAFSPGGSWKVNRSKNFCMHCVV